MTKIKDSFGFIDEHGSHRNVFFHKTQIAKDSAEIAVGGTSARMSIWALSCTVN